MEIKILLILFLLISDVLTLSILNKSIKSQGNMKKLYKNFYMIGVAGFIVGICFLSIFLFLVIWDLSSYPFLMVLWICMLLFIPLSAVIIEYSWLKNADYNLRNCSIPLPDNYTEKKEKFHIFVLASCLTIGAIIGAIVEVYIDGVSSPFIRNWYEYQQSDNNKIIGN